MSQGEFGKLNDLRRPLYKAGSTVCHQARAVSMSVLLIPINYKVAFLLLVVAAERARTGHSRAIQIDSPHSGKWKARSPPSPIGNLELLYCL